MTIQIIDETYLSNENFQKLRGRLLQNESLSKYTSWKVGGPVNYLYQPADIDDLSLFLSSISKNEPLILLGAGTNVLCRDEGFAGTVILLRGAIHKIIFFDEVKKEQLAKKINCSLGLSDHVVFAQSGAMLSRLIFLAADAHLSGLELLAGIPGTVGGALAMNAGAYRSFTWDHVVAVETMNRKGECFLRAADEFQVGYRKIESKYPEWFVGGYFKLTQGRREDILNEIKIILGKRQAKHPLHLPNAGSVFMNPDNDIAARIIESCGLKNYRVGGACISEKHANFIVNDRSASAKDIEQIIQDVQKVVKEKNGIDLMTEIKII